MPTATIFEQIASWCAGFIQSHPALSVLSLLAIVLLVLIALWQIAKWVSRASRAASRAMLRQKRKDFHGFGIVVSTLSGPKGGAQTKTLIEILQKQIGAYCFGAPYEVTQTPPLRAKGVLGLRDVAAQRMTSVSGNLISWGKAAKKKPIEAQVMSRDIDPDTGFGRHETIFLPQKLDELDEVQQRAVAYMYARVLQPGLSDAAGYRKEKIKPIADLLSAALGEPGALPPETLAVIEDDYCTMALHVGELDDMEKVVKLRRARLLGQVQLDRRTQIKARIDLGRALLRLSEVRHDPARIREAMDHLKQAVDLLRAHPAIKLATATSDAVRQGEKMLTAKKRFSVLGGSAL